MSKGSLRKKFRSCKQVWKSCIFCRPFSSNCIYVI